MPLYLTHLKIKLKSRAGFIAARLNRSSKMSVERNFSLSGRQPNFRCKPGTLGFTVMEMIVVMAVFSVVVVSSTDIFFIVNRAHRKLVSTQSVQRDMRFALETMVRELHQGTIDYDYYSSQGISLKLASQVQGVASLALIDPSGRPVRFQALDQDGTGSNLKLQVSRGQVDNWQNLLSDNIRLVMAKFYVVPESNPFVIGATASNQQPRVTMVFSAQSIPTSAQDQPVSFFLQTTIVSRNYQR